MQDEMKDMAQKWISYEFRNVQDRDPKNSWDALDEAVKKVRLAFIMALDKADNESKDQVNQKSKK